MSDRAEMLEAALDLMDGGVAVLDKQSNVVFWNKAAMALTGYVAEEVIGRPCPLNLYRVDEEHRIRTGVNAGTDRLFDRRSNTTGENPVAGGLSHRSCGLEVELECSKGKDELELPTLVSMIHKLGYSLPGMLRKVSLRDGFGESTGTVLLFYPVEDVDALPHGESGGGPGIERSQADMEDRLDAAHHLWTTSRMPFGLLWITVDQAHCLRKTHGAEACEAMLRTVEQTLLRQMKPSETIGRWGNNEFLVLAHERTAELLLEHAQRLAGLARTADFRWWGDRVGLTVSVGVSYATDGESLQSVLNRARQAMQTSTYAGGNCVTEARGR
jgi:diguanylate cyclase (GGDEF)-like protein